MLMRRALELLIGGSAGHGLVEVNFIAVEVGAVNAGKLGYAFAVAVQRQAAAAAHAGTVYHDGVHGYRAGDAGGLSGLDHEFHHYQGTDGYDFVKLLALGKHFVKRYAHVAMAAVGTIVGHEEHPVGHGAEIILKYYYILGAEADYAGDVAAHLVQLLRYGQGDCAANAAADYANLLKAVQLCGGAKGADEVMYAVAHVKVVQLFGCCADYLEYYPYGAVLAVVTRNGERYTFAVGINAQYYKLARLSLGRYIRSFDVHKSNRRVQVLLVNNLVHVPFLLILLCAGACAARAEAIITIVNDNAVSTQNQAL